MTLGPVALGDAHATLREIEKLRRRLDVLEGSVSKTVVNNEVIVSHTVVKDIGTNDHDAIDAHMADPSIHFTTDNDTHRMLLVASIPGGYTTHSYAEVNGITMSSTRGWSAIRAGSIIGLSATIQGSIVSVAATFNIQAERNGTKVFEVGSPVPIDTGNYSWSGTQAVGLDPFTVDDVLAIKMGVTTFSGNAGNTIVAMEIQYD